MNTLLKQFERFVIKQKLFEAQDHLLVAVSGGMDSVVLVHLLKSMNQPMSIAHCNFNLRGEESNKDAKFVKDLAKALDLSYYEQSFETKDYMTQHKLSIQEAARELRYNWFDNILKTNNLQYVLTAHHANDQVETMLYNLNKGSGISGLRGIPLKNDRIIRPLLFAHREDIVSYAESNHLEWCEDSSNQEDKYSRNRLRLRVIPELKEINPGLERTMLNNSRRFEALEKLLLNQVETVKKKYLIPSQNGFSLSLDWYEESTGSLAVLIELLKPLGFNTDQCFSIHDAIVREDRSSTGKQFFSRQHLLIIDRKKLHVTPQSDDISIYTEISIDTAHLSTPVGDFAFETSDYSGSWSQDPNEAYLDAALIKFPIVIRTWEEGDTFYPLGMKGKKKLSDFMIDEKIPLNLKSRVVLFESNQEIIWVAGYRIDNRYKVTPQTRRVLIIKMTNHV